MPKNVASCKYENLHFFFFDLDKALAAIALSSPPPFLGGYKNAYFCKNPFADAVAWNRSMDPAGNETSKETRVRSTEPEMQSALLPRNDPYQNNCGLSTREYQRIVVERNNELAQHVIIIHVFDKYRKKVMFIQPKGEEQRRVVWRETRRALLISVSAPLQSGCRVPSAAGPSHSNNDTFPILQEETEIKPLLIL